MGRTKVGEGTQSEGCGSARNGAGKKTDETAKRCSSYLLRRETAVLGAVKSTCLRGDRVGRRDVAVLADVYGCVHLGSGGLERQSDNVSGGGSRGFDRAK